jgi:ubiquinone biosynthesis protein COQ9
MIAPPERSPERDAALEALLPVAGLHGWTVAALRMALADIGADPGDAELLFPGGAPDMIEAAIDLADRRMEEAAPALGLDQLRLPERVRALVALRLRQNRAHREAIRRALAILALPRHAVTAARVAGRTLDAIWHTAGDRSADFSWYTKRATLGAIYGSTLLYWLHDTSEDDAPTLAFLDRRLADHARLHKLQRRIEKGFERASSACGNSTSHAA